MTKRIFLSIALLLAVMFPLSAVEAGLNGGWTTQPDAFCYGFTVGSGLIVPLLRTEFELFHIVGEPGTLLSAGVKIRPKLGKVMPYAGMGVGVRFEKINFDFSSYRLYTYFGGGIHFLPISILSLRADVRLISFSDANSVRITAGVFLHL